MNEDRSPTLDYSAPANESPNIAPPRRVFGLLLLAMPWFISGILGIVVGFFGLNEFASTHEFNWPLLFGWPIGLACLFLTHRMGKIGR